jgi:hypothetical protein
LYTLPIFWKDDQPVYSTLHEQNYVAFLSASNILLFVSSPAYHEIFSRELLITKTNYEGKKKKINPHDGHTKQKVNK